MVFSGAKMGADLDRSLEKTVNRFRMNETPQSHHGPGSMPRWFFLNEDITTLTTTLTTKILGGSPSTGQRKRPLSSKGVQCDQETDVNWPGRKCCRDRFPSLSSTPLK